MADDIVSILTAAWSISVSKGFISYNRVRPIRTVSYGVILTEMTKKYMPMDIQAPFGTDNYYIYFIGRSQAEIETLMQEIVRIVDAFTGNTTYDKLKFLPDDMERLIVVTEFGREYPVSDSWQVYMGNIFLTRKYHAGHRLYQPETNNQFAETK
jgi:hypothetical protein